MMPGGPEGKPDKGIVRTPPGSWLEPEETVRCSWPGRPGRGEELPEADPYDYGFDAMPI